MSAGLRLTTGLLVASALCLPVSGQVDTQTAQHPVHKVKKQPPCRLHYLGTARPRAQIPLDAIPAVAPQVSYQDGL